MMDGFEVAREVAEWLGGQEQTKALELVERRRELAVAGGYDWVTAIAQMHGKFGVNEVVDYLSPEMLRRFLEFRVDFLGEELSELRSAETPEDVVDALVDLCVVAIGTLDAFRVDARQAWAVVHAANVAKEAGVNESRKNDFGFPDMTKPEGWTPPSHAGNVGLLARVFAAPARRPEDD